MCHSETKYGDKQNKKHWNLQTVNTTWKIDAAINLIKTVGACKPRTLLGKQIRR